MRFRFSIRDLLWLTLVVAIMAAGAAAAGIDGFVAAIFAVLPVIWFWSRSTGRDRVARALQWCFASAVVAGGIFLSGLVGEAIVDFTIGPRRVRRVDDWVLFGASIAVGITGMILQCTARVSIAQAICALVFFEFMLMAMVLFFSGCSLALLFQDFSIIGGHIWYWFVEHQRFFIVTAWAIGTSIGYFIGHPHAAKQ